ncbi:hypothetical protein JRC49_06150 [Clostridiales bacterium FE2011]|nr:hypothetical protein JRC49_06150 [Clostridiales bacterium FE2011]QTE73380.1 hypothetical protein JS518_10640 [Clostridiales bacterium FE2010]
MKNNEFQELVDQNLSGLVWDERKRQRVLHALNEEEKPVKKFSTTFILIAAIVCLSVTALAAGLIFSPKYDAVRISNQAMEDQYGITPDLLSLFWRDVKENEDGTTTVVYSTTNDVGPVSRIGEYTVMVDGPKATVSWSNEGKDTSGGLSAEAYGPDQLHIISYDYGNAMQQLMELGIIPSPDYSPNPRLADGQIDDEEWTEEDQAEWEHALAEVEEDEKQRLAEIAEAESRGKITVEQAADVGKEAIIQEYTLTKEQADKLEYQPDMIYASYENDEPLINLCYCLWQKEGATFSGDNFTEKDGQYWVTINLLTGVIEDLVYDSGLAGNG